MWAGSTMAWFLLPTSGAPFCPLPLLTLGLGLSWLGSGPLAPSVVVLSPDCTRCLHQDPASFPLKPCSVRPPQERQRLETILNLCAEYSRADGAPEAGELPSIGEAAAALALAGRRPSRGLSAATGASGRGPEEPGGATQRLWECVDRSDEENLKEECSSTESTQQEVGWWWWGAAPGEGLGGRGGRGGGGMAQ